MMIPISSDWYESAKMFCGFSEKIGNMIEAFMKDKFELHLDKRLSKIEYMQEEHSKAIIQSNSRLENISTSSDALFLFHRKNVKEPIKLKTENEASLLNSQINTIINDLNNKLKETESALNAIDALRNKAAKILSLPNNRELEIDFRTTCSAIQTNSILYDLMQAYQDYINAYKQKTSLYNITRDEKNDRTNLYIYNTETETQEVKTLRTPVLLDSLTCIALLPNGKLFCFGNNEPSRITVLIDMNGGVEVLPPGPLCESSSCIYFNNSVYCFGGKNEDDLTLSGRFDLDQNRWIRLTPMPQADYMCTSIIFNGNILISGDNNRNLLLYSINIDSFSTIPYEFEENKRKILINAERLYLIECYGSIYESETGSYSNWRQIGKSEINNSYQVYCSYNNGGIYILNINLSSREYYFFNLDQKITIDVAYYDRYVSLRRVGKKIEADFGDFKLDSHYLDEWNLIGNSLITLGKDLGAIERCREDIRKNPEDNSGYLFQAQVFYRLERNLEALKCYNEALEIDIRNNGDFERGEPDIHYYRGRVLNKLERYPEALESYEEAIENNPYKAKYYNGKGNTLYALERYEEAIECYDQAIKLEPNNPLYFCSRARAFNILRQEEAALQDFNKAYNLKQENVPFIFVLGNFWIESEFSKEESDFIDDVLGLDSIELLQKMQI